MDIKAKKILLKTFWCSNGWRFNNLSISQMIEQGFITLDEFEYAKSKGIMFDDIPLSHEDCIKRLKTAASKITMAQLINAFLTSLSSRKIYLRSAISSFNYANKIEVHEFTPCSEIQWQYLCGECEKNTMYGTKIYSQQEMNVLNFERIKWGGLRFEYIIYCMLDLEQFLLEEKFMPTKADIEFMKAILNTAENCDENDGPRQLEKKLKDVFPSSKDERDVMLEILAELEILKPSKIRGVHGKNDWGKIEDWRGEDKYDKRRVMNLFGDYL